ncbi:MULTISPECIES: prepilin-type N-terminal cleavage/methylation domain-containing protein [Pseudomonas]|jgi:general secretion pathway protein J|uniref:Prepilin-type N-terminal cleavage/methylation domain-containing protein n=1 Tax=Pseudomonas gingeri TaxID=117681 RepID=A0A7Y7WJ12_9PSED|nr:MULTISPECIES: prepilin-type N-terminal cleavage/methylation domain-containing protein [Pseudomonas]MCU1736391.1 prepilin-type N-terminal cleavage/methylation domain-containing protein [Pseudomonas sp. 20S_6.2_Bac1]NWB50193.1 prepilin-type N-terminal cleavage/methylation domain-containing protein [Pseudomonas gingeri]
MKSQPRGFTLLEVLVALSLLGLLMVLIASALVASNHTQELGERYSNRLNEVRSAQDFLRSAAQQAYPMVFLRDAQNLAEVFDGEAQQMRFVAPLPARLSGGLQLHAFSLVDNRHGSKDLQVAFFQFDAQGLHAWGDPQILLPNLDSWQLSYRGLDPRSQPTGWLPRWPWPERLPLAIRIELQASGPIPWAPLVVAIRLSTGLDEAQVSR